MNTRMNVTRKAAVVSGIRAARSVSDARSIALTVPPRNPNRATPTNVEKPSAAAA